MSFHSLDPRPTHGATMRVETKDQSGKELLRATTVAHRTHTYLAFSHWIIEGKGESKKTYAIFKSRAKMGLKKPLPVRRESRGRQSLYR